MPPVRLHWLDPRDPNQPFPPAHRAKRDSNSLLATGSNLSLRRMVHACSSDIFSSNGAAAEPMELGAGQG